MSLLSHAQPRNVNSDRRIPAAETSPASPPPRLSRDEVRQLLAALTGEPAESITAFALFTGSADGTTSVVHSPNADPVELAFSYLTTAGN